MLSLILDKHIVVETNPSSNVVIGPIDGYDSHTVHKFIKDGIRATINTDDKGIFPHHCLMSIRYLHVL